MKALQPILFSCGLFLLAACNNNTTETSVTTSENDTSITTTKPVGNAGNEETIPPVKTDTAIIKKDLSINDYLQLEMKDWNIPAENTWEDVWVKKYEKGKNKIFKVEADFVDNNKNDYAYILKNAKDEYAVWAFLKTEASYRPIKVYDITKLPGKLHVGLGLLPPGTYNDINGEMQKPVTTKLPAIHIIFFGTAAKAYYWKNDQFNLIQTGD